MAPPYLESGLEIKKTMKGRKAVDKRRFLKIFSSIIISLLLLASVITILLNSRYVQNRVLALVTELLSEKLKTEVAVDGVSINLFDQRIQFLGVEVEDLQHRKMLQVKSLSAAVSLSDLLHHKVSISNARINGLRAEIHKENPDSAANYQFIIDAIQKESKGKKHKDKKPTAFTADVSRITLQNFNVQYNDQEIGFQKLLYHTKDSLKLIDIDSLRYNNDIKGVNKRVKKKKRGDFYARHLDVAANVRLTVNHVSSDSVSATLTSFEGIDRNSGLEASKLSCRIAANKQQVHLSNVTLVANSTTLSFAHGIVHLPNKETGQQLTYSTSTIYGLAVLADIARPFAPVLSKFTTPLYLSVQLEGNADGMNFRNVNVFTHDKELKILAYGYIHNMKNKKTLIVHFRVSKMQTDGYEVQTIINQFPVKKFMMKQLVALGNISYKGAFDIPWRKEKFWGRLSTEAGHMDFNFGLDENVKFLTGVVSTDSFCLGKVIDKEEIKKVACKANFKFDYSKERTARMRRLKGGKLPIGEVKATVNEAVYDELKLKDIQVDIKSDGAEAQGSVQRPGSFFDVYCNFSFTNTDMMKAMKIKPGLRLHKKDEQEKKDDSTEKNDEKKKDEKRKQTMKWLNLVHGSKK